MPTINELKKEALNDAGYSGSISDAEYKWLKAICDPYVGSIPDMWRYALLQAGYPNSVTVGQNEMLIDLGHTGAIPDKWYKYWRDTPLQGVGGSTISYISAPTSVTVVEPITNPPSFVMNYQDDEAAGSVLVGDVPQLQFDSAGTIYDGEAVTVLGDPVAFTGVPPLAAGTYDARIRFVRDEGGPGEVIGAWSVPSAEFEIAAASKARVHRGIVSGDSSLPYITDDFDLGDAAADRFVIVGVTSGGTVGEPVITGVSGLTKIVEDTSQFGVWIFAGVVASGSGVTAITATMSGSGYQAKGLSVWTATGLDSTTVKGTLTGSSNGASFGTQSVDAGDLLFMVGRASADDTFTTSPTQAPDRQAAAISSVFYHNDADWEIDAASGVFSTGRDFSTYTYVSARWS